MVSVVLSGRPSQSKSFADVQSRVILLTAPMQRPQVPLAQVCVPGLQMPTIVGPHGCVSLVTQGQPSFALPLQLASSPLTLQLSAAAGRMLHALQAPLV